MRYPLDSNLSSGFRTTGAWMTNFMGLIQFHLIHREFSEVESERTVSKLSKTKVLYCVRAVAVVPGKLKQRRRRRQRERQKNNNSTRARFFVHFFFAVTARLRRETS